MADYSKDDKRTVETNKENNKRKIEYTKIVMFIIISYGLFYPMVNSGQSTSCINNIIDFNAHWL